MRSAAPASSAMYSGFSYRMSMTAVPISIRLVRAPTAASSGNGDPSCLAKWCTRKYAPSAPSSSAATARSIDCRSASDADRVFEPGDDDQCPNDRKPIFFTSASTRAARAAFLPREAPATRCFLKPTWAYSSAPVTPGLHRSDRIRDESDCVLRYERTFMRPLLPGYPAG